MPVSTYGTDVQNITIGWNGNTAELDIAGGSSSSEATTEVGSETTTEAESETTTEAGSETTTEAAENSTEETTTEDATENTAVTTEQASENRQQLRSALQNRQRRMPQQRREQLRRSQDLSHPDLWSTGIMVSGVSIRQRI